MFTGIVEDRGRIAEIDPVGNKVRIRIDVGRGIAGDAAIGDSIAIDGCCLTVVEPGDRVLGFEAVPETMARTALGDRRPGDRVNLERALRAESRLGGHFVLGHVDGTGRVAAVRRAGDDVRFEVACGADLLRGIVAKGSVAIDGVSLTVVDVHDGGFSVALIPHTLAATTLGERRVDDRVNLEVDVIGRYVLAYLDRVAPGGAGRP